MFWVLTVSPINRMFRTRCQASGPVMKFPHAHETSSQLNGCGGNLHTSKARLDRWDRGIAWWKKAHVMPYASPSLAFLIISQEMAEILWPPNIMVKWGVLYRESQLLFAQFVRFPTFNQLWIFALTFCLPSPNHSEHSPGYLAQNEFAQITQRRQERMSLAWSYKFLWSMTKRRTL